MAYFADDGYESKKETIEEEIKKNGSYHMNITCSNCECSDSYEFPKKYKKDYFTVCCTNCGSAVTGKRSREL
jgi:hypothetical protein